MKVLKVLKKILIGILGLAFFGFVVTMTILLLNRNDFGITQFDNTSLIIIKEKISFEHYKKGDLVLVEGRKLEEIQVGEELFVYKLNTKGPASIDVGIVGEVHTEDKAISFENGATYSVDFVAGKADKVHSKIGSYLSIILSQWGFLFIILVPSLLIFIYELYAIVVEVRYGKNTP